MSIEAAIKEGSIPRYFGGLDKLEVDLQAGGTCYFVPEEETRLTTKSINKNGIYRASDDGDYGWSSVTVNVTTAGRVTGKGDDGNEHAYSTDGEGNIVDTKVPSRIVVTTPPTNPYGIYTDGQSIGTEGMVVTAYYEDGTEWGIVPIGEITLEPNRAEYGEIEEGRAGSRQTITASWSRPGDGAVLEATFDIIVGPIGGQGED